MPTHIDIDVEEYRNGSVSVTIEEHDAESVRYDVGKVSSDDELTNIICERLRAYLSCEDE